MGAGYSCEMHGRVGFGKGVTEEKQVHFRAFQGLEKSEFHVKMFPVRLVQCQHYKSLSQN